MAIQLYLNYIFKIRFVKNVLLHIYYFYKKKEKRNNNKVPKICKKM